MSFLEKGFMQSQIQTQNKREIKFETNFVHWNINVLLESFRNKKILLLYTENENFEYEE